MSLLTIGTDLSGRYLTVEYPEGTSSSSISEYKIIAKGNSNCILYEQPSSSTPFQVAGVFCETPSGTVAIFQFGVIGTNPVPEDFGAITEIDETAFSYPYISRNDHEKIYVLSEDSNRLEIIFKEFEETGVRILQNDFQSVNFFPDANLKLLGITECKADILGSNDSSVGVVGFYDDEGAYRIMVRNFTSSPISDVTVSLKCTFIKT